MARVKIRCTAVYHPPYTVNNETLAAPLGEAAGKVLGIWEHFGRRDRYYATGNDETTLAFGVEAAKRVLAKSGLHGEDLDLIVFSSGTHEYQVPSDASHVHKAVDGKNGCAVYDSNANCVGMVVAAEQAARCLQSNPKMKYALVVGSEQIARFYKERDYASYGLCGDAACAVLLERADEEGAGFLDSAFFTDTREVENMLFPSVGITQLFREDIPLEDKKIYLHPEYNVNAAFPAAVKLIQTLMAENGLSKEDISAYILSQLNYSVIRTIAGDLEEDLAKFPYIGDVYGYTGTSSPFIALHHAMEDGRVREGDLLFLWSVGSGITSCATLWRI